MGQAPRGSTRKGRTRNLVVSRVFDVPVGRVWQAWTDPEHVKRWWGPKGYTAPVAKIDFREGGTSLVCMRSPNGREYYNTWTYQVIRAQDLIEFVQDWADKDGNRVDPAALGLPPNLPRDVHHMVSFHSMAGNQTLMTVTEYGYTSDKSFNASKAGLEQCLDKMAAMLAQESGAQ